MALVLCGVPAGCYDLCTLFKADSDFGSGRLVVQDTPRGFVYGEHSPLDDPPATVPPYRPAASRRTRDDLRHRAQHRAEQIRDERRSTRRTAAAVGIGGVLAGRRVENSGGHRPAGSPFRNPGISTELTVRGNLPGLRRGDEKAAAHGAGLIPHFHPASMPRTRDSWEGQWRQ